MTRDLHIVLPPLTSDPIDSDREELYDGDEKRVGQLPFGADGEEVEVASDNTSNSADSEVRIL